MRRLLPIAMLLAASVSAASEEMKWADRMGLANNIANILMSERICDLAYDQEAIARFVEQKVPADDMEFVSTLQLVLPVKESAIKEMTPSTRTAHCAQIRRTAKSYGFVK